MAKRGRKWTDKQRRRFFASNARDRRKPPKKTAPEPFIPRPITQEQINRVATFLKRGNTEDTPAERAKRVGNQWISPSKGKRTSSRGQFNPAKPGEKTTLSSHKTSRLTPSGKMVSRMYSYTEAGEEPQKTTFALLREKLKKFGLKFNPGKSIEEQEIDILKEKDIQRAGKFLQRTGMTPTQALERRQSKPQIAKITKKILDQAEKERRMLDKLRDIQQFKKEMHTQKTGWKNLSDLEKQHIAGMLAENAHVPKPFVAPAQIAADKALIDKVRNYKMTVHPSEYDKNIVFGGHNIRSNKAILQALEGPQSSVSRTELLEKQGNFVLPPVHRAVDMSVVGANLSEEKKYGRQRMMIQGYVPDHEKRLLSIPIGEVGRKPEYTYFNPYGRIKKSNADVLRPKDTTKSGNVTSGKPKNPKSIAFYDIELGRYALRGNGYLPPEAVEKLSKDDFDSKEVIDIINASLRKKYKENKRLVRYDEFDDIDHPKASFSATQGTPWVIGQPTRGMTEKYIKTEPMYNKFDSVEDKVRRSERGLNKIIKPFAFASPQDEVVDDTIKPGKFIRQISSDYLALHRNDIPFHEYGIPSSTIRKIRTSVPGSGEFKEGKTELEEHLYNQGLIDTKPGEHPYHTSFRWMQDRSKQRRLEETGEFSPEDRSNLEMDRHLYGRSFDQVIKSMKEKAKENYPELRRLDKRLKTVWEEQKESRRERQVYDDEQDRIVNRERRKMWMEKEKRDKENKKRPMWSRFIYNLKAV